MVLASVAASRQSAILGNGGALMRRGYIALVGGFSIPHGRYRDDLYKQPLHVEIRGDERLAQVLKGIRTIGQQRLFHYVME